MYELTTWAVGDNFVLGPIIFRDRADAEAFVAKAKAEGRMSALVPVCRPDKEPAS